MSIGEGTPSWIFGEPSSYRTRFIIGDETEKNKLLSWSFTYAGTRLSKIADHY